MKWIIRQYYILFHRNRCFKNTLMERRSKWTDFTLWNDVYLGNDWWLHKKI